MDIEFTAKYVDYAEAIGGDIVQVVFSQDRDEDYCNRTKLYLLLSSNYEFGSPAPDAEWYDGEEENGGEHVTGYKLDRAEVTIRLRNGHVFKIKHHAEESVYKKIETYVNAGAYPQINAAELPLNL